jgi:hypothetical protein
MFEPNRHDVRQLLERHPVLLAHAPRRVYPILSQTLIVAHRLRSDCSKPGILVLSGWLTCPKSEASEPP